MAALGHSCDLGLVSPEWLQRDANFDNFDAFGKIDELLVGIPDFEAMSPPLTCLSCFATTTTGELQRLQEKNIIKKYQKIDEYVAEPSPEMAGAQGDYKHAITVQRTAAR